MKKIIIMFIILAIFTRSDYVKTYDNYVISKDIKNIDIMADITEWRYKKIEGKTYRRLYNLTRNRWETPWMLVN